MRNPWDTGHKSLDQTAGVGARRFRLPLPCCRSHHRWTLARGLHHAAGGIAIQRYLRHLAWDGTEFESAFLPPAAGDVCVGVWKKTSARSVKLHHVGWLFNPRHTAATATNTFTLDEEVTVAAEGKTYSGKFTFKEWNLDGTPTLVSGMQVEVTGTIAATRITVD